jgi:hypothetical protein
MVITPFKKCWKRLKEGDNAEHKAPKKHIGRKEAKAKLQGMLGAKLAKGRKSKGDDQAPAKEDPKPEGEEEEFDGDENLAPFWLAVNGRDQKCWYTHEVYMTQQLSIRGLP